MHKLGDLCWYGYQRRTWAPTLGTLVSWKRVRTSFLVSVSRSHTRRDRHDCTLGLWKLFTVFVRRDSHPVLVLSGCGPGLTALESDGFGHGVRSRAGGAITKRCFTCFTSLMNLHGTPSEPVITAAHEPSGSVVSVAAGHLLCCELAVAQVSPWSPTRRGKCGLCS